MLPIFFFFSSDDWNSRKSHFNFGGKFEFRLYLSYYSCIWNVPFDSYFLGDKFVYRLSNPIQTLAHWIEYPIRKLQIFDLILYNFIHTSLVINSNISCRELLYILFLYIVRILLTGSIEHPSFQFGNYEPYIFTNL